MARPPDEEKKRVLAREAVALMQRDGVDMPMSQLADALGVKRPTLLYHFPTRSHIVESALEELLIEQFAYVSERVERASHPIDRLYAHITAVHAFHHGHEARLVFLTQALATTAGARMAEIVARASMVFESARKANAARVREGVAQGIVAPCDANALVSLVRAVTDGLMLQRVTERVALAPVHEALWQHVLAPLKITEKVQAECPSSPPRSSRAKAERSASRTAASSTKRTRTRRS